MPASRPAAISATGLRKSYGELTVLDGIDLTVAAGTVLALLGPNGAGKTTTVNILSTLIRADGGTAEVAGHDVAADPDAVRSAIGVTGQFSAVDGLLTADGEPAPHGRPAPPAAAPRAGAARPPCSSGSSCRTPPASPRPGSPAACSASSTWR